MTGGKAKRERLFTEADVRRLVSEFTEGYSDIDDGPDLDSKLARFETAAERAKKDPPIPRCQHCGIPSDQRIMVQSRSSRHKNYLFTTRYIALCDKHAHELFSNLVNELFRWRDA